MCFGKPEHRVDGILVIPCHVADVAHNADDFEFAGVLNAVHAKVLPNRVLVLKEASNKGLIDDGDRASHGRVLLFDGAALHDFCAEGFKEAGHDAGPASAAVFLGPGFGAARNTNALIPAVATHGRVENGSDPAHSGYAQEALIDTAEQRLHLFGLVVAERRVDGDEIAALVSKPKFCCSRFRRLWPRRAAAESRTSDIAACAMTSDFCAMEPPPRMDRLLLRIASTGSTCEVIHAGAIPKQNAGQDGGGEGEQQNGP